MRIDVHELERRPVEFDTTYLPGAVALPDDWRALALRAEGVAELLDREGSRTIRIKGRISGRLQGVCSRCLEEFEIPADMPFDLYFYPMSMIARNEETAVSADDLDYGFYEDPGLELADAVGEQIQLWLPMRALCRPDCAGICPHCGTNWNEGECDCDRRPRDPRWEALKNLKLN